MTPTKSKKLSPETAPAPEEAQPAEAPPEPPEEESEAERLREEVQRLQEALARMQAELVNQQKRHEREREAAARYRVEPLARELLDILDAMEEARDAMTRDEGIPEAVREGQALTVRHLINIFDRFSIEAIDPAGESFDPQLHEAVAVQPAGDCAPGSVMEVFRKGYRLQDRLLRPARVVVAAEATPEGPDGDGDPAEAGRADPGADST